VTLFAAISGLGGKDVDALDSVNIGRPWWAARWPDDRDVSKKESAAEDTTGALICNFHKKKRRADCYFKTVDGVVHDKFSYVT